MQKQLLKINVSPLIRLDLALQIFHGFDTLGPYSREKGRRRGLYTCGSKRTLIQYLTVNRAHLINYLSYVVVE
jgi:hypothetical protein